MVKESDTMASENFHNTLTEDEEKELHRLLEKLCTDEGGSKCTLRVRNIKLYNPGGVAVYVRYLGDDRASGPWNLDHWRMIAFQLKENEY